MRKLRLIVGASWREQSRWARQHLYVILILSPLVTGMTYVTLARVASYAPEDWRPEPSLAVGVSVLVSAVLAGLSLSRASREIFHLRRPESVTDALPVGTATHLHAAFLTRLARNVAVGLGVLLARTFFGESLWPGVAYVWLLALFVVLLSLCEMLAALEWIHWGHRREKGQAALAVVVLAPSLVLVGLLLLVVLRPGVLPERYAALLVWVGGVWCVGLYALLRVLHERWRAQDIEYAKRLQAAGRWTLFGARVLERKVGAAVAAQLARDLQLTLRAFSSAVYTAAVLALLWVALLGVGLTTGMLPRDVWLPPGSAGGGWAEATWLLPVVASKVVCVLMSMSLVAVLPVLVAYQLPHWWLESATGTTGETMWRAKLWYARLLTLPAPFVVWALGVGAGAVPAAYVLPLLLECLWLWWIVSTLAGSLAFEIPEQPGLSILLMAFVGLSGGLLTAWMWPAGLLAFMFSEQMTERAQARARFALSTEEV